MVKISILLIAAASIALANAHTALVQPSPRGIEDEELQVWTGFTPERTFPCNGYGNKPSQIVTHYKAGDIAAVRFSNLGLKKYAKELGGWPPTKLPTHNYGFKTARHGGGLCEFTLSYDGGKTWHVFNTYHKTCPDIYYEWKVKIPENAPSCTKHGECLFGWHWTAHLIGQYYHNCADVSIEGVKGGKLSGIAPQIVDIKGHKGFNAKNHQYGTINDAGDGSDIKGPGPMASDEKANGVYRKMVTPGSGKTTKV